MVKAVSDVIKFVMEIFCDGNICGGKTEGGTDGDHFYSPPPGRRGTKMDVITIQIHVSLCYECI